MDAGPDTPLVAIWHGNGDQAADFPGIALELKRRGLSTVIGEFRGFAGLAGLPDEAGLQSDADATLAAVAGHTGPRPMVLLGRSLGTGIAAAVAADPSRWHGFDVRGLLLVSPYTSLPDVGARVYPFLPVRLLLPDRFDTLTLAPRIRVPTVVIHGEADTLIPFSFGQAVAHAIPGATLIPLANADHKDVLQDAGEVLYEQIVRLSGGG